MSFYELYFFVNKSDTDGSGSSSPSIFSFLFSFGKYVGTDDEYVGSFIGVGFGNFVPTGIESLGDVVQCVVFVPIGVDSERSQLIESFWRQ